MDKNYDPESSASVIKKKLGKKPNSKPTENNKRGPREGRTDSKSLQMGGSWLRAHKQLNYQQAQAKLSNRATDPKKNNLNRGNNKLKNKSKINQK